MQQLPNPVALSSIRQLVNWIARPYDYLDECADRYVDTFTMRLFDLQPLVFFSHPQAVKDIFSADVNLEVILQTVFGLRAGSRYQTLEISVSALARPNRLSFEF